VKEGGSSRGKEAGGRRTKRPRLRGKNTTYLLREKGIECRRRVRLKREKSKKKGPATTRATKMLFSRR